MYFCLVDSLIKMISHLDLYGIFLYSGAGGWFCVVAFHIRLVN